MSPCESARHAGEVRRAAGLPPQLPLERADAADTGLGGPGSGVLAGTRVPSLAGSGGLAGPGSSGLPGPGGPGSGGPGSGGPASGGLPGPGVNTGAFATVGASHGSGPVALSKAADDS